MTVEPLNLVGRLNLRDLGGKATMSGLRVREQRVYRAAQSFELSETEVEICETLGLSVVLDLRTASERDRQASEFPAASAVRWLDVLGPDAGLGPARLGELFSVPARAADHLGGGVIEQLFADSYRAFVTSERAQEAYRGVLQALVDADGPVLFHCAAGKDRTGWASALVLTVLGVDRQEVMADYLVTNESLAPSYAAARERFVEAGGDGAIIDAAIAAAPAYLGAAFEELDEYGGAEAYVVDVLGLGEDAIAELRSRLLAPAER